MAVEIYFPAVEPVWEFDRSSVRFYAVVVRNQPLRARQTVVCLVSAEALVQHFGARNFDAAECLRAFNASRTLIEEAARRKIEDDGDRPVSEIVLTTRDFPTTTTTIAPDVPGLTRVQTKVTPDIQDDPDLLNTVQRTTRILDEDIIRGKTPVSVHWTGLKTSTGPLLYLRLQDRETEASADGLYPPAELSNESAARHLLFRLWDDLLRKKGALLLQEMQNIVNAEGGQ